MLNRRTTALFVVLLLALTMVVPFLHAQDDMTDVYGRALPEDAAPYSQQVWHVLCDPTATSTTFSQAVRVYETICGGNLFSDQLVVLDNNLNIIPGAAESWEPSEDGLTWTFHLRPDQVWSDGTPLTAYDYEATYRWMADPANAYDFTWYWDGIIKNWHEAVAGEVPPEEIGYKAIDDLTISVETDGPRPYLPNTVFYWGPLQKKSLEEIGPEYMVDPATSVSSGPFILREYVPGDRVFIEANPTYNGFRKPILKEIRGIFTGANAFQAFQAHEIEQVGYGSLTPADFEVIDATPILKDNYFPTPGDFRTDYLVMDTYTAPFNDLRVRQAFAKAVDRDSIANNVIGPRLAIPAYSFLTPGFPASDTEGALREYQAYDCEAAKQLLADAGFPNGEGFPELTMQIRADLASDAVRPRYDAAAASISSCLNVTINTNSMDSGAFMQALAIDRPTTLQFGGLSYGMDYVDASNMLGLWLSTGRHSWFNEEFDNLVTEANGLVGDPERRAQLYKDAEKILVEDVGGIFLNHRIQGDLWQPYVLGSPRALNAQGQPGVQWGNEGTWADRYIGANISEYVQ